MRVLPLVSVTLGHFRPRVCFGRACQTGSLYYNGVVFFRLMLPFYVGLQLRWSGSTTKRAFLQTHVGWKLNGDFAVTFRVQSDDSGRISNKGPDFDNHGQATGWDYGPK